MRIALVALVALVFAPAAAAWTPISTAPLHEIDKPSALRTNAGTELVTWGDDNSGLWLWSDKGTARQIEAVQFVNQPRLVQQPSGAIQIYVGSANGVERFQSIDNGASWTGPFKIVSPTTTGPVESATVRSDGTPMFTQDSTLGINVFQGLNGEQSHQVFSACCGYGESLAVDTSNYAQLAFWAISNAFPYLFVYEGLDASGGQAGPGRGFGQPQTAPSADTVPLVADGVGNTFMGWAGGYPAATSFAVNSLQGGNLGWSTVLDRASFGGGNPHTALAVDPSNRLWAVWSEGTAVHARRSRSAARHFGAPTAGGLAEATVYHLAAIALPDGRVDAFINDGHQISHETFLPGLTLVVKKKTVSVLDDGFGVNATLKGGGHTAKTTSAGIAKLVVFKRGTRVVVGAAGYAPASFKAP